jgi:hypothetical protein
VFARRVAIFVRGAIWPGCPIFRFQETVPGFFEQP